MSDTLRDRIAAAVLASLESETDWVSDDGKWLFGVSLNGYEVADAVIAALEMKPEQRELMDGMCGQTTDYRTGKTTNHYRSNTRQTRYITPWKADDE